MNGSDRNSVEHFVGIDVAKAELDVAILPAGETFTLDYGDAGLATLVERLKALKPTLIVIEATGGYERRVAGELTSAGLAVAVVNPARVRALARGAGTLAKNDRLDALNLARFAQIVRPQPAAAAPAQQAELDALVARRRQLVQMITMESNRLQLAHVTRAKTSITTIKASLEAERKLLDKAVFELLRSDDTWNGKLAQLTSVPGVGKTTAATLLAEMPDPFDYAQGGTLGRRQIASLAGLAPFDRDSGTLRGKRFIRGGRVAVRVALHMAALTATRCNPDIQNLYQRLRAAGKPFRSAMVACARKLLTILNSLLRHHQHWNPHPT